jgi:hypothetical protein
MKGRHMVLRGSLISAASVNVAHGRQLRVADAAQVAHMLATHNTYADDGYSGFSIFFHGSLLGG